MNYPLKIKDPDATLDYSVDWTKWFGSTSDTISSVDWIVPSGITQTAQSHSATVAVIWLAGGTVGQTYLITCRITTAGGRTDDFTFRVQIQEK